MSQNEWKATERGGCKKLELSQPFPAQVKRVPNGDDPNVSICVKALTTLGELGRIQSASDEADTKKLVSLLGSPQPADIWALLGDLWGFEVPLDAVQHLEQPPLVRHVAAEALLAFATRDDDEKLWLQDVAVHGGCDDLLEILKKDVAYDAGRDAAYDLLLLLAEVDGRRHTLIDAVKKRRGTVFWDKHERNLNDERALKSALRALKVEAEVA